MTPKLFKALEVCEATGVQPYVLRSWEKEFPGIGIQRGSDSPRLYRQSDVEQVRRIKELVFAEGLTLAGARRRMEESGPKVTEEEDVEVAEVLDALGADVRARIVIVRDGLRSILNVLSTRPGARVLDALPRIVPQSSNGDGARPAKGAAKPRVAARPKRAAARKPPARAKSRPATKAKRGRART